MNTILIFLGAGIGGVSRYWFSNGVYWVLGRKFPYGTLFVNITGCFLMGVLFTLFLERATNPVLRSLLLIGFLGGYTTFSAFSIETVNLIESGDWLNAMLNILFNVIACIILTWLGVVWSRHL